jgi:hypothetical protein
MTIEAEKYFSIRLHRLSGSLFSNLCHLEDIRKWIEDELN